MYPPKSACSLPTDSFLLEICLPSLSTTTFALSLRSMRLMLLRRYFLPSSTTSPSGVWQRTEPPENVIAIGSSTPALGRGTGTMLTRYVSASSVRAATKGAMALAFPTATSTSSFGPALENLAARIVSSSGSWRSLNGTVGEATVSSGLARKLSKRVAGMAKLTPVRKTPERTMPTTLPAELRTGPPEFPGFNWASS